MTQYQFGGQRADLRPVVRTKVTDYSVIVKRKWSVPEHERECVASAYSSETGIIWIGVTAADDISVRTCLDVDSAKAFVAILQREIGKAEAIDRMARAMNDAGID